MVRSVDEAELSLLISAGAISASVNETRIRKARLVIPIETALERAVERACFLRENRDILPLEQLRRYLDGRKFTKRVWFTASEPTGELGPTGEALYREAKKHWYWEHNAERCEGFGRQVRTGPDKVSAEEWARRRSRLAREIWNRR